MRNVTRVGRDSKKSKGEKPASKENPANAKRVKQVKHEDALCVVGMGASAGGLEALTVLFKALSPTLGMAYVLVPHMDPARESAFSQILARSTRMPVTDVEDGMKVEPDHVYVIVPNCDLAIRGGVLHLVSRHESRTVNTTIDIFFRSLAADQGKNAIGIVLSGTATDGTQGLAAIKGEGGITFAQDTRSAKYDGMPASAFASGYVDFVLPPGDIAKELARIREHPYVAGEFDQGLHEPEAYLAQIFRVLRRTVGVDFSEYKPPTVRRRIERRMALHKIHSLGDYVAQLHQDRSEVMALYQDLLINVTSFFRDPEVFESLKKTAFPEIVTAHRGSPVPVRIWVPGCSTGEETYSHAIALVEYLSEIKLELPMQIFGTDLSESAVQRARAGNYKESIEADVTPARLRRFFHKNDSGYQISKTIRDVCIFSTQDIFSDPPFSRIDLISFRNVMIYLSQALQRRIIPILHYALNRTGFLVIGNAEGLVGLGSELFEMVDKKQKIYRNKPVTTPFTFGFAMGSSEGLAESDRPPAPTDMKTPETPKASTEWQREADRLLLARYAPPAVVVNEQLEILHIRGRTGAFLELPHGKASLHLLKMARPGLLSELQKAIEEARNTNAESTRHDVRVSNNGNTTSATIRVLPFRPGGPGQTCLLVVFEPAEPQKVSTSSASAAAGPLTDEERANKDAQITQLSQELAATKEYLQAIIESKESANEELQSANEEIQSGNEELQSTNEELQTSKEELESANEELHTVNEEMQHRNDLLTQLNNDLNNLLNNVDLPMLMVASDLTLRRFSPPAGALLGLMNTDVGRPLPRLKISLDVAQLEQMLGNVMRDGQPKEHWLRDSESRAYRIRMTPYKTLDNRIDGAVLNIIDVESDLEGEPGTASPGKKKAASKKASGKKR